MSTTTTKKEEIEAQNGEKTPDSPEKRAPKVRGKVIIHAALCKGCGLCVNFCPRHTLVMGGKLNDKGYHYPVVDKDNCTACDLCGMLCPDFAIYAFKLKSKEK
jgi:2-oxoglutarate ferredoxin oxidoreductase subunit delta